MQNPREEIAGVVHSLTTTSSPVEQLRALEKRVSSHTSLLYTEALTSGYTKPPRYYVSDAAFDHLLCRVDRSPNSRDSIVDIYQYGSV